jgi:hypothetical protein
VDRITVVISRYVPRTSPISQYPTNLPDPPKLIQVLAIEFHAVRGEIAMALPLNIALLSLSLSILSGRSKKLPVPLRGWAGAPTGQ